MSLLRLGIDNVRCIERAELTFGSERNFVVGANGAGKTTILECIYLLGRGRSFRTREIRKLLRHGAAELSVFGEIGCRDTSSGESVASSGEPNRRLGIGFGAGKLRARIDAEAAESLASLARLFPVHVIDPRLHQLIEAGPSERRRFVDAGVFHVEHDYLVVWREYRRLLGQRNAALKAGGAASHIDVWTAPLVAAGESVDRLRRTYLDGLGAVVSEVGRQLLGTELECGYSPGWRRELTMAEALERSRERDQSTGYTQVGPHRADIEIRLAGGRVRDVASRGQQKLVAAALVLGQVLEFERRTNGTGTLLIDDPAAELDEGALERLLAEARRVKSQTVITGLRLEPLGAGQGDPVFHVELGKVRAVVQ